MTETKTTEPTPKQDSPCEISFYHLTQGEIDKSTAKLLEKAYQANLKSVLVLNSDEEVEHYNKLLWTFASLAFLPHGTQKDKNPERQPVYLSKQPETINDPSIVATVNAKDAFDMGPFKRCLDIFNGHDNDAVTKARQRWKLFHNAGYKLTYWKQNESGKWFQETN